MCETVNLISPSPPRISVPQPFPPTSNALPYHLHLYIFLSLTYFPLTDLPSLPVSLYLHPFTLSMSLHSLTHFYQPTPSVSPHLLSFPLSFLPYQLTKNPSSSLPVSPSLHLFHPLTLPSLFASTYIFLSSSPTFLPFFPHFLARLQHLQSSSIYLILLPFPPPHTLFSVPLYLNLLSVGLLSFQQHLFQDPSTTSLLHPPPTTHIYPFTQSFHSHLFSLFFPPVFIYFFFYSTSSVLSILPLSIYFSSHFSFSVLILCFSLHFSSLLLYNRGT